MAMLTSPALTEVRGTYALVNGYLPCFSNEAMGIIEYAWNQIEDEDQKARVLFYRRMQLDVLGLISHPDGTKDLAMETWRTSNAELHKYRLGRRDN